LERLLAILLCAAKECKKTEYYTIDIKEELVDFQRKHLTNPFGKQIVQHLGKQQK
jgi:hypothetical protein